MLGKISSKMNIKLTEKSTIRKFIYIFIILLGAVLQLYTQHLKFKFAMNLVRNAAFSKHFLWQPGTYSRTRGIPTLLFIMRSVGQDSPAQPAHAIDPRAVWD